MKRNFFKICISLLLILSFTTLKAVDNTTTTSAGEFKKVGAAGSQFLKIAVGARGNGMGGAYGAVADDLTAVYWNPAGLADIKGMSANFAYTQWFAGFSHSFGAFSLPVSESYCVAVHLISFNSDNIPITTVDVPDGNGSKYKVNDVCIGASFSGYLTDQFSFGVTGKYVQNSFSSLSSNGISFDVGTMYKTGIQGIKLGFSIHNLGSKMNYAGQDLNSTKKLFEAIYASPLDVAYISSAYSMPLIFRAGITTDIISDEDNKVIAAGDFVTTSDLPEQFSLGAEYTWKDFVSLRAGYLFGHDKFGFGGGVGLKYIGGGFKGDIGYSINPIPDFGLVNRISVNLKME